MRLSVHEIQDAGVWEAQGTIPAEDVAFETADHPRLLRPVAVDVHASADEEQVTVWGRAEARVRLDCARCLEGFETDLHGPFELTAPVKRTTIEIADDVRQSLLLALPAKPLCRPDCRGLCPRCGRNRNAGACGCPEEPAASPFAKLKDFKTRR